MGTWVAFVLLAVATNTALGPPFDPVLLWFAAGRPWPEAWVFVVVGSLCAGAAGALEASVARRFVRRWTRPSLAAGVGPRVLGDWARRGEGRSFYLFAMPVAASPLPFTVVRVAALVRRPHPLLYGACVAGGRLPRYAVTVLAWDSLGVSGGALLAVAAAGILCLPLARRLLPGPRSLAREAS